MKTEESGRRDLDKLPAENQPLRKLTEACCCFCGRLRIMPEGPRVTLSSCEDRRNDRHRRWRGWKSGTAPGLPLRRRIEQQGKSLSDRGWCSGIVAGLCTVPRWLGLSGSHSDWFVHVEAETLVRFSDHIVIARYVDETIYELPDTSTAGETSPSFSVDVYKRFEVVETLKGSFTPGNVAHVAWNVRHYDKRQDNGGPEIICQGRRPGGR